MKDPRNLLRVYIAAPFSSDPPGNTERAMKMWHELRDMGYAPYVPHLTFYLEQMKQLTYDEWMEQVMAWMHQCHAVLRLPGVSPGADIETEAAGEVGIPVFYDKLAMHGHFFAKGMM